MNTLTITEKLRKLSKILRVDESGNIRPDFIPLSEISALLSEAADLIDYLEAYEKAVDHELVLAHIGIAKGDPRTELNQLLTYWQDVATDPKVNGGYCLVKCRQ